MTLLILGLLLFLGVHSVSIVNAPWRDRMHTRLGEAGWKGVYSLVSLAGFVLIIYGYGAARMEPGSSRGQVLKSNILVPCSGSNRGSVLTE